MRGAALALAVVALAGCGGDGDRNDAVETTGERLSKAVFVSRANGVCARFRARIAAIGSPEPGFRGIVRFLDRAIPLARAGLAEQERLRPPARYDSVWSAVLSENRRVIETAERLRSAAQRSDPLGTQREIEAFQSRARDEKLTRLTRRLGLTECADALPRGR